MRPSRLLPIAAIPVALLLCWWVLGGAPSVQVAPPQGAATPGMTRMVPAPAADAAPGMDRTEALAATTAAERQEVADKTGEPSDPDLPELITTDVRIEVVASDGTKVLAPVPIVFQCDGWKRLSTSRHGMLRATVASVNSTTRNGFVRIEDVPVGRPLTIRIPGQRSQRHPGVQANERGEVRITHPLNPNALQLLARLIGPDGKALVDRHCTILLLGTTKGVLGPIPSLQRNTGPDGQLCAVSPDLLQLKQPLVAIEFRTAAGSKDAAGGVGIVRLARPTARGTVHLGDVTIVPAGTGTLLVAGDVSAPGPDPRVPYRILVEAQAPGGPWYELVRSTKDLHGPFEVRHPWSESLNYRVQALPSDGIRRPSAPKRFEPGRERVALYLSEGFTFRLGTLLPPEVEFHDIRLALDIELTPVGAAPSTRRPRLDLGRFQKLTWHGVEERDYELTVRPKGSEQILQQRIVPATAMSAHLAGKGAGENGPSALAPLDLRQCIRGMVLEVSPEPAGMMRGLKGQLSWQGAVRYERPGRRVMRFVTPAIPATVSVTADGFRRLELPFQPGIHKAVLQGLRGR